MRHTLTARLALAALIILAGSARTVHAGTITLTWDPSPDQAVAGYIVYVGTQSGIYTQTHDVGGSNWFVLPDATAGQRYYLAVASYAAGPLVGAKSGEVSGYSNAPPALADPGGQSSVVGVPVTLQLLGTDPYGEPVSYTAAGLPPGLHLTPSTGFIQGTGTAAGTFTVLASASDGVLSAQRTFSWTMTAPPATTPPDAPPADPVSPPPPNEPPAEAPPIESPAPPPVEDAPAPPVSVAPPSVAVTAPSSAPSFAVGSGSVALAGTATGSNVTMVSWVNSRGGSGVATGTDAWTIPGISLQVGTNVITVTAYDGLGQQGSRVATILYVDSEAPTLALVSPATSTPKTYAAQMTLAGTAADNVGVARVTWTTDRGLGGTAAGSDLWSAGPIDLDLGVTRVMVTAEDAAGNRRSVAVTVTRLVEAEPPTLVHTTADGESYELPVSGRRSIAGGAVITRPELEAWGTETGVADVASGAPVAEPVAAAAPTSLAPQTRMALRRESSAPLSPAPSSAVVQALTTSEAAAASRTRTTQVVASADSGLLPVLTDALRPDVLVYPTADVRAPAVTVTNPRNQGTVETAAPTLFLVGVAVDDLGVATVSWTSNHGASGIADGTSVWSADVPLEPGENVITVTARDEAGHVGTTVLTVTRRE